MEHTENQEGVESERTRSKGTVIDYKAFNFVDGEGVRNSLYLNLGCMFHCEGCYNVATWSFDAGIPYTQELEEQNQRNERFSQLWIRLGKLLSVYWASGTFLTCLQVMVVILVGTVETVRGK